MFTSIFTFFLLSSSSESPVLEDPEVKVTEAADVVERETRSSLMSLVMRTRVMSFLASPKYIGGGGGGNGSSIIVEDAIGLLVISL